MTSPIADGVMAATHKLVNQAMSGEWQSMPKTIEERRVLLDQLRANAQPQDQQWLGALQQAMAESDAAVATIAAVGGTAPAGLVSSQAAEQNASASAGTIDGMLDMIKGGRAGS